jgi:hypothetical protein
MAPVCVARLVSSGFCSAARVDVNLVPMIIFV